MSSTFQKTLYEWQLFLSNLVAEHGPNATLTFTKTGYDVTPPGKESGHVSINVPDAFKSIGMSEEAFKQYVINERCC